MTAAYLCGLCAAVFPMRALSSAGCCRYLWHSCTLLILILTAENKKQPSVGLMLLLTCSIKVACTAQLHVQADSQVHNPVLQLAESSCAVQSLSKLLTAVIPSVTVEYGFANMNW